MTSKNAATPPKKPDASHKRKPRTKAPIRLAPVTTPIPEGDAVLRRAERFGKQHGGTA